MNKFDEQHKAYEKAKKRLELEKGFYSHLRAYIIINIIILLFRTKALNYVGADFDNEEFKNWLNWNIILTPLLWGIGLLGHGLWVFKGETRIKKFFRNFVLGKSWEERKIREFMDKDDF